MCEVEVYLLKGSPQGPGFLSLNWGMRTALSHSLLPEALPQRATLFLMCVCTRVPMYVVVRGKLWLRNAIFLLCNLVSHWSGTH